MIVIPFQGGIFSQAKNVETRLNVETSDFWQKNVWLFRKTALIRWLWVLIFLFTNVVLETPESYPQKIAVFLAHPKILGWWFPRAWEGLWSISLVFSNDWSAGGKCIYRLLHFLVFSFFARLFEKILTVPHGSAIVWIRWEIKKTI